MVSRIVIFQNIFLFSGCVLGSVMSMCLVDQIQVQPDFDIGKYQGKWYEQYYYSKTFYGPNDLWEDVTHTYTLQDDGNLTVITQGRTPDKRDECFTYTNEKLVPTSVKGKLSLAKGNTTRDYWVVSTDYTGYAVAYGCQQKDTSGGCNVTNKVDVWVWSRQINITDALLTKATAALNDVCVDLNALIKTPNNNECKDINARNTRKPTLLALSGAFIVVMALTLQTVIY